MAVTRLSMADEDALRRCLEGDRLQNVFPIGFLDASTLQRGLWWGFVDGGTVRAAVMLVPGRLAVPWSPDPAHAAEIGAVLRQRSPPCLTVGPRAACDALWGTFGRGSTPERFYHQRLYVSRAPPGPNDVPGFRAARPEEWRVLADYASQMEIEDLGRDPAAVDPESHEAIVRDRIRNERTWVIERDGAIVFTINIGLFTADGCQVGGTFVPPAHRGRGIAKDGMRALVAHLRARFPAVTLHVNEANRPAVRTYEAVGFTRHAPFRLITVKGR